MDYGAQYIDSRTDEDVIEAHQRKPAGKRRSHMPMAGAADSIGEAIA